jgi:hypothetical protein
MVKGLHTKQACEYLTKRYGKCLYCLSGSVPVDKSVIVLGVESGVK